MIETENLTKKFGDLTAVDGVSFSVSEGEVFGFLGPNGAGKTTTVRMLCCLISKTSGKATIGDYEIGNDKDSLKIRNMIGVVPDNVGLYETLSAYKNLDFYGRLYGCSESKRKENIQRFLTMLGLWVTQSFGEHVQHGYHRRRVGLNHVAFRADSRKMVDGFHSKYLRPKGIPILYGGPRERPEYSKGYYSVYFEDPDRIKLELVYSPGVRNLSIREPGD